MERAFPPRLLLAWAIIVGLIGLVTAVTRPTTTARVTTARRAPVTSGVPTSTTTLVASTPTVPDTGIPALPLPTLPVTIPSVTLPPVTIPLPPIDQRCPADWVLQQVPSNAAQNDGEIAGRITGPCNRPIEGICATLWQFNGSPGLTRPDDVAMQTVSDSNGYYRFENVPERDNLVLDLNLCDYDGSERRDMPHYDGHARTEDWALQPPSDRFSTPSHLDPFHRHTLTSESHFLSIEPDELRPSCAPDGDGYGSSWTVYEPWGDNDAIQLYDPSGDVPGAVAVYVGDDIDHLHEVGCFPSTGAAPMRFDLNHGDSLIFQSWTTAPGWNYLEMCNINGFGC